MTNSKKVTKRRAWTEKRRKLHSDLCKQNKPWEHTTGPKTDAGKQTVRNNSITHGMYTEEAIMLRKLMFAQRQFVNAVRDRI